MADPREPETVVNLAFGSEGVTMSGGEGGAPAWDAGWKRHFEGERRKPLAYNKLAGYRNGTWMGMKTWHDDKAKEPQEEEKRLVGAVAASTRLGDRYGEELRAQCEAWRVVQEDRMARELVEKEEAEKKKKKAELTAFRAGDYLRVDGERAELAKRCSHLEWKNAELEKQLALWEQVGKKMSARNQRLEAMVFRRRRARATEGELGLGCSMVAHRLWELTGRSDWASKVRFQRVDGLDVMDMTLEDVRSFREADGSAVEDPEGMLAGVVALRDVLTRPVAELVAVLRESDDPVANWYEAQALLKWAFANGKEYGEPVYQMVNDVADVAERFKRTGDKDVRTMSVVWALEDVLRP